MISKTTKQELLKAIANPLKYGSGGLRKQLQATYDKMLSEVSESMFSKPLTSRMSLRQQLNALPIKSRQIELLLEMMRNESMLFNKDYREHSADIENFLNNHVVHFLKGL
jgi:hypothetical protein